MRRFSDPEELVAFYWQKLTSSVEGDGALPHSKTQGINGRLRSQLARHGGRLRQRSAALRNGKHPSGMRDAVTAHAPFRPHSNS